MNKKNTVILERCFIPANGLIMREDDIANCAYLIQSGKVQVFTEKPEPEYSRLRSFSDKAAGA